jgi:CRP-like cAMP-binding protein
MFFLTRNHILNSLTDEQRTDLTRSASLVSLVQHQVLYGSHTPIEHVYFLEDGVASIGPIVDGRQVEASQCGADGMVGLPQFFGVDTSNNQAMQVVPGVAWRVPADAFQATLAASPTLRTALGRFSEVSMATIAQNAGCLARHTVDQRICSWLLAMDDRIAGPLPITHAFIAKILGVRRATVTTLASALSDAQIIENHRGVITVKDRVRLLKMACDCYLTCKSEYLRLLHN